MLHSQKIYQIGIENEVKCPECGNTIELDWNEEEECCGHHCGGECGCDDCGEDEEVEDEYNEDDM